MSTCSLALTTQDHTVKIWRFRAPTCLLTSLSMWPQSHYRHPTESLVTRHLFRPLSSTLMGHLITGKPGLFFWVEAAKPKQRGASQWVLLTSAGFTCNSSSGMLMALSLDRARVESLTTLVLAG